MDLTTLKNLLQKDVVTAGWDFSSLGDAKLQILLDNAVLDLEVFADTDYNSIANTKALDIANKILTRFVFWYQSSQSNSFKENSINSIKKEKVGELEVEYAQKNEDEVEVLPKYITVLITKLQKMVNATDSGNNFYFGSREGKI
jgi:hypothetical protein